jgi:glycosyltransferase involved in cell wall biosynthesis
MKILILNNLYGRLQRGGAEIAVNSLISGLMALGHEVTIISSAPDPQPVQKTDGIKHYEIRSKYYNLSTYGNLKKWSWHLSQFISLAKYRKIKKIVETEKPEAIITNNMMGLGWLSYFALAISRRPIIQILHDVQLIYPSGLIYYGEEKRLDAKIMELYRLSVALLISPVQAVISPSRWLLGLHQRYSMFTGRPSEIIANPQIPAVDVPKADKKDPETLKLIFVGQLEKHKGIDFLSETLKKADWPDLLTNSRFNKVRLEIIGSGSLNPEQKTESTGLLEILYLGKLEHDLTISKLTASDILIFPSLCYENAPMVIKEAATANIGIIASNIGGVSEMLQKTNTFTPGDPFSLLTTLKREIGEIENGRPATAVSPSPSPRDYAEKIIDIIRMLL